MLFNALEYNRIVQIKQGFFVLTDLCRLGWASLDVVYGYPLSKQQPDPDQMDPPGFQLRSSSMSRNKISRKSLVGCLAHSIWVKGVSFLKVIKYQEQIILFSFPSKNEQKS